MPKFMTYNRPAPGARQAWKGGGRPGTAPARPGRKAPKPAPEAGKLDLRLDPQLPGLPRLKP